MFFKKGRHLKEKTTEFISDVDKLRQDLGQTSLPESVHELAIRELEKAQRAGSGSAEYTIAINYLEYLISLPWTQLTKDNLDLDYAKQVLDQDHFGLAEVKDRILEHLAVRTLKARREIRVLVVDDEELTCKNMKHVLTKAGYKVVIARSGEQALDELAHRQFNLVITDLKMGAVDGLEVLERAKALHPTCEVIVVTGYATVPTAVKVMKKGSYLFLSKPLKLDEIKRTVAQALEKQMEQLEPKGPMLCFLGPPGTGKTSLGMAIARSLGRKFIHMSLAGVKDEAQIRGHRRSYVGALPGRIIQEIRRAGSRNPVFMLDEMDKIGQEFKGDPASALLEVLDPEQNRFFIDHYLDVPFDLSKVMFITTANTLEPIPGPLLDRLEILHLPGYTIEEKVEISFSYLIPKALQDTGLADWKVHFTPRAVEKIVKDYTREAGLRNLQRQIAAVCRKTAREVLQGSTKLDAGLEIDETRITALLGPKRYHTEVASARDRIGVSTGLAWTPTGGEIMFIEAVKMKGQGNLILTGSLGDVLKESAQAALSYLKGNTQLFALDDNFFASHDLHIHVPAGAIPKDGPSAGLAIAMALHSLVTSRPCKRDVALSGEITLTGRVLPVGGVREKLLAAKFAGVKRVVFPARNRGDFEVLSETIKKGLELVFVSDLEEVIEQVLV